MSRTSDNCSSNQRARHSPRALGLSHSKQIQDPTHNKKLKKYIRGSLGHKYETNLSGSCPLKLDCKKLSTRFGIQPKKQQKILLVKEVKQDDPEPHNAGNNSHNIPYCKNNVVIRSRTVNQSAFGGEVWESRSKCILVIKGTSCRVISRCCSTAKRRMFY